MGLGHGISLPNQQAKPYPGTGDNRLPMLFGLAADRPLAQSSYIGWCYTVLDENSGTLYQCQYTPGTANPFSWVQIAAPVVGTITPADANTLTGTTLASNVVTSSLTSVGTLTNLTVTNPITGSITGSSGSTTGNASTVTTNANLTGPITSSGNTTAITSQTGTGTKFVVDTSPTLVTPNIGAATATSINGNIIYPGTGTLVLGYDLTVIGTAFIAGNNSGDQTNISGNAATVTTNANLTGPITSSGNATAVTAGAITLPMEESRARPVANLLINGGFDFAQRQAPATLTSLSLVLGTDKYSADRWRVSAQNADVQYVRTDTNNALESGLNARFYGSYKKITSTGKFAVFQILEGINTFPLASRTVTFQCKMKIAASTATVRLGLIQLNSSGTIDTVATLVPTTWGADGTDPTLNTNIARVAPDAIPAGAQGSVNGNAVDCSLTTTWQLFAGTFTMPSNAKNIIPAVWTNAGVAAGVILEISEAQFNDGTQIRDWLPRPYQQELALCQRYYTKTFNVDIAPAQALGNYTAGNIVATGNAASYFSASWTFPVSMRTTPVPVTYNPTQAASSWRNDANTTSFAASTLATGTHGTTIFSSAATGQDLYNIGASADVDI